ncbi:MAG: heavy metal translocating P-type ATPase metal-binding domain-containing protein [Polyangia bacterium]
MRSTCPHCHSPIAKGAATAPYCCTGCRAAHELIEQAGLSRFYDLLDGQRLAVPGSARGEDSRTWLAPLIEAAEQSAQSGTARLTLDLQGLQCAACVWLIERLFRRIPGARAITINPALGRAEVFWQSGEGSRILGRFLDELQPFGYRAGPPRKRPDDEGDDLLLRFGLCAALAMNSMIFSFAIYFGLEDGGGSGGADSGLYRIFSIGSFALATAALLLGGSVFVRSAIGALRRRILHMDVPIALGMLLAYAGSAWAFVSRGGQSAYFDTLTTFIALMLMGRLIQRRIASHNRRVLLSDEGIAGFVVRAVDGDGRMRLLPASELRAGQELLCAPGELLPTACECLEERALLSLEWISGEAEPRLFTRGDRAPAGAHNLAASAGGRAVRLRATEDFRASALCELLRARRDPSTSEPRRDFWHHLSRYYVLGVLALAALGLGLWLPRDGARALEVTAALLMVTCPCALGVATPLAYELAQGRLRRLGLFVRDVTFFDRALRVRKVLFDKTGTLTALEPALENPEALRALGVTERGALYQLVARSNHPRSRALLDALVRMMAAPPVLDTATVVLEEPGRGLVAELAGQAVRLGTAEFVGADATTASPTPPGSGGALLFSIAGTLRACFRFREELRPDARDQVDALAAAGYKVWLLSGDQPERVSALATRLGVPAEQALGGLRPEDKAAAVQRIGAPDSPDTMMIGDGINDALAFHAALCAGTPATERPALPARADFYFLGHGLGPIAESLATARFLRRVIVRNLLLSGAYNVAVVALALAGMMTPLRCALLMPVSSLLVVLATLRSFRSAEAQAAPREAPLRQAPRLLPAPAEVTA